MDILSLTPAAESVHNGRAHFGTQNGPIARISEVGRT